MIRHMPADLPVLQPPVPVDEQDESELPVLSAEPRVRADAARNSERILAAARKLFASQGVSCTSMEAIAREAGVGKGTLFRRFGDRAGLAMTVLDTDEREFQEAFMRGPGPLGPGAPPCERLKAFGCALLDHLEANWELLLEGESIAGGRYTMTPPYRVRWLHVRGLLAQLRPEADVDYLTDALLAPLSAASFAGQRMGQGMELDRIKAGYSDLVDRALARQEDG